MTSNLAPPIKDVEPTSKISTLSYAAVANANQYLFDKGYAGCCLVDGNDGNIRFVYATVVPYRHHAVESIQEDILNAANGALKVGFFFQNIGAKVNAGTLTFDDVFFNEDADVFVKLHPLLRFKGLPVCARTALQAFLTQEDISIEMLDEQYAGSTVLEIYPVVSDTTVSVQISTQSFSQILNETEISLGVSIIMKKVSEAFAIYRAIMTFCGLKPAEQAYKNAHELFYDIEEMLC